MPSERVIVGIGLIGTLLGFWQLHHLSVILEPAEMQSLLLQSRQEQSLDDDEVNKMIDGVFPTKYARGLDRQMVVACNSSNLKKKKTSCKNNDQVIRIVTYNTFRMFERSDAADLIGNWLQLRGYDFVALQELNGGGAKQYDHENNIIFDKWAQKFGFESSFLLITNSGFHIGFVARSKNCQKICGYTDGFMHGVLHIKCEKNYHFLVTHLTPVDTKTRSAEAVWLKARCQHILAKEDGAAIAIMGDLNAPPIALPYKKDVPWAIESLANDRLRLNLKRKFLNSQGLDTGVTNNLLNKDTTLRDPCLSNFIDQCSRSVPTSVGLDESHAINLRLDHLLLSDRWHCHCSPCISVIDNLLTDSLSDHYPLQAEIIYKPNIGFISYFESPEAQLQNYEKAVRATRSKILGSTLLKELDQADKQTKSRLETIQQLDATEILSKAFRPHLFSDTRHISDIMLAAPLQLYERVLACNYTHKLAEREIENQQKSNTIKTNRQKEWLAHSRSISGRRLGEEGWRIITARQGDSCRTACENNTNGFCFEGKAKDHAFLHDCDRMTTVFSCPFGCHSAQGDELPAFVSDESNFHAGRCLIPSNSHHRRRLLQMAGKDKTRQAKNKNRQQRLKEKRRKRLRSIIQEGNQNLISDPTDILLAEQFNIYGLQLSSSDKPSDKWCQSKHPQTSRLCPCFDAFDLIKAKPLESCDEACASNSGERKHCHDSVLRFFNSRACPLYHKRTRGFIDPNLFRKVHPSSTDQSNTNAVDSLPLLLDMNINQSEFCLYSSADEKRSFDCAAKPRINTIPQNLLPKARRLRRICPCVMGA
mmetsp:Transcript_8506/g.13035  ORF Transcript_8506/g.13035 Transcript_8506/m.13035 type:complete len:818 (-) Transcript_8506:74-2527(-)|eukprot:CAMPEP_0197320754 /NCGR_PEP_ID=MMETSP0891-20130614/61472_1 /TAXON_ID=44058 ORGANISM="Aureoumbra lagunensis, Strain CCMP1510" /NCGR_SAMPLE_ID=MMETSP0891 /ASSEMBLY_ACC=CAM_ASM_000534 /LENGTH=817 /DNA_ID=CAMNT_0042812291 /DNA_START=117 /DNA_END=2570 /DNA_ORIENTATION=-